MTMERTCKKCGETKPIELFPKNKNCKEGRIYECTSCAYLRASTYRAERPDVFRDRCKKYYMAHKYDYKSRTKAYREQNRELCNERTKAWRLKNKEKIKIYGKQYNLKYLSLRLRINPNYYKDNYIIHKDRILEACKKYRELHKDVVNKKSREYYMNHINEMKILSKQYRIDNKYKIKENRKIYYPDHALRSLKNTKELTDVYLRQKLRNTIGLDQKTLKSNPELIENHRQQLKVKRLLKSKKNENIKTS